MRHHGNEVEFSATVELPLVRDSRGRFTSETEEVEVTVKASVTPPTPPTIRMDPDDCDPGDSGDYDLISVTRDDTGEDITDRVDAEQFQEAAFEQANDDYEGAREDAMISRAELRAEMRAEYDRDD